MAQKTKPDLSGYKQLKKDLTQKTLGNLYIFHGEESYLREYYLGRLKEQILDGGLGTFNLHEVQGKDVTPEKLGELVDCLPMMAERTLIIVTDYDFHKAGETDRDRYAALFGDLPDYCCLILVYDLLAYKPDARMKLSIAMKKAGVSVNFARQEQGDLVDWIRRRFRAMDKDIDSRLAMELIFLCGDLMTNLATEVEKIGAYSKNARITREDIDAVATPQLDAVVFQMTDQMGQGNFDRAMGVLGTLYQMQEAPIKIMWSLSRQMRQLYTAKLMQEAGKPSGQLAGLLGLQSYSADKVAQSARRFSLSWCRRAVVRCGEVDFAMKSSGLDHQQLLTSLMLELAVGGKR